MTRFRMLIAFFLITSCLASGALADAAPPWADLDYPDIDYNNLKFEAAYNDGNRISGWWAIKEGKAPIDDSPTVFTVNLSADDPDAILSTGLSARCREGETSIIFVQDAFLIDDRSSFKINYRIDSEIAQLTHWNALDTYLGAGLFGSRAEVFLRNLKHAKKFFIRLTEKKTASAMMQYLSSPGFRRSLKPSPKPVAGHRLILRGMITAQSRYC